jgi:hypothetical protein
MRAFDLRGAVRVTSGLLGLQELWKTSDTYLEQRRNERSVKTHQFVFGLERLHITLRAPRPRGPLAKIRLHGLPALLAKGKMLLDRIEEFGDIVLGEVGGPLAATTLGGPLSVAAAIIGVRGMLALLPLGVLAFATRPPDLWCWIAKTGRGDSVRVGKIQVVVVRERGKKPGIYKSGVCVVGGRRTRRTRQRCWKIE